MSLTPGRHLGPYEVVAPIGSGGMGEVYRARDPRLGREVALKVLPEEQASDPARLRRFETEARAVAALNHPHILSIFDLGTDDGTTYVVFELLEGRSLRTVLGDGPLPARKVVDYAQQICRGLDAAHSRGILHRDLKPGNLFLTADGQIKILDFGLAKLRPSAEDSGASGESLPTETRPDAVLGTLGYMSPEQARGKPVDARSDLFSLGTVLYEMLAGRQPFLRETAADTLSAILNHDPPDITTTEGRVPLGLERVVRRCLEKDPQERFRSAMDVAFALDALSSTSGVTIGPAAETERRRFGVRLGGVGLPLACLAVVAIAATTLLYGRHTAPSQIPSITQLTYRRGLASPARFAPDGRTVVFSALWDGRPSEVFRMRLEVLEPEPLGLTHARLLAVSSQAELAVLLGSPGNSGFVFRGTLARLPLSGGQPREVLEDVIGADWSPDGRDLAVLREERRLYRASVEEFAASTAVEGGGTTRLEYPIGTVLVDGLQGAGAVRVHPSGDRVAVLTGQTVLVVGRSGTQLRLETPPAPSGLAWDPGGEALWVSGEWTVGAGEESRSLTGRVRGLWRLTLDGHAEELYRGAGGLTLDDISHDGRILVHFGTIGNGVRVKAPGEDGERELQVTGEATAVDISADGAQVLTAEQLPQSVQAWLRPTTGGPGRRVVVEPATTQIWSMTPDARWVLIVRAPEAPEAGAASDPARAELVLVPTGPGEERVISTERFGSLGIACFFDTNDAFFCYSAAEPGQKPRGWIRSLSAENWRPITPEGVVPVCIRWPQQEVVGETLSDHTYARYPLDGGPPQPFPASIWPDFDWMWNATQDGRFGSVWRTPLGSIPCVVERIDLDTGLRMPWRTIQPEDATGMLGMSPVYRRSELDAYAYSYRRYLQDLFLFEGLR
jgi:hypothetical protein